MYRKCTTEVSAQNQRKVTAGLLELMQKMPYEEITVTRLCQSAGVLLSVVPRVKLPDGTVISSSAIRQALRQGDLSRAEEMLGRPVQDMWKSQER